MDILSAIIMQVKCGIAYQQEASYPLLPAGSKMLPLLPAGSILSTTTSREHLIHYYQQEASYPLLPAGSKMLPLLPAGSKMLPLLPAGSKMLSLLLKTMVITRDVVYINTVQIRPEPGSKPHCRDAPWRVSTENGNTTKILN